MVTDIEGNILYPGDEVLYATTIKFGKKTELLKLIITKITEAGNVKMGKHLSTEPNKQLYKIYPH